MVKKDILEDHTEAYWRYNRGESFSRKLGDHEDIYDNYVREWPNKA